MKLSTVATSLAAILALTASAGAVTVKNTSSGEFTVGVDYGDKEKIETIAAGKSVDLDCPDGCGVTGPWGFSWMASGKDSISSNGQSMVTHMDGKKPE
jgi:hypothetical protein